LIGALNDSDAAVRADVAFALGKLNDSSPVVIQSLAQYARRPGEEGVEASAALGRLDSLAARPALEAIITDPTVSARAKQEALLGIGKLHPKPQTLDLMQPFVASTDVETRWRAVYALTRGAADPRAVPLLIRLLSDSDALVRALAVRGLRAAAADSAKARPETMAALRNALADPHPHVRVNAVTALGGYRSAARVQALRGQLAAALAGWRTRRCTPERGLYCISNSMASRKRSSKSGGRLRGTPSPSRAIKRVIARASRCCGPGSSRVIS